MSDYPSLCVIQLTPPGRGAIATLRIEGPTAIEVVEACFRAGNGRPLSTCPIDRLVVGHFGVESAEPGEEVVVRRCTDGSVEVHCHGGYAAVARIEDLLVAAGFQSVPWQSWAAHCGDDPFAAAAWVALAEARTERTAAILLDQYQGALRRALDDIQQAVAHGHADSARQQIDALLARAALGRHLVEPWRVVFGGPANVGKSSLINALLGYGRSIVHDVPGTTRDAVTAITAIDGWPVELCDTAGLRPAAHGEQFLHCGEDLDSGGGDPRAAKRETVSCERLGTVELAGIRLAKQRLTQADLVVLVFDHSVSWSNDDETVWHQWPSALVVHNKADLPPAPGTRPAGSTVSALQGNGLAELLEIISSRLVPNPPAPEVAVPLNDEQLQAIQRLSTAIGLPQSGQPDRAERP
jgi:tRNA modification GTPase